ncbi:hypothetical protein DRJ17_04910 [Candidatus Woesearchaeota archaeon]|nr:MAG: hypothetical protein DRJ17_04910 [Candidatus Woesearchaeota archaeon]
MKKIRHMSKKMDITSLYLEGYSNAFTGREIARKLSVSPQTALTHLKELVRLRILNANKKGRNIEYSLNLNNLQAKLLIEMAELNKSIQVLTNPELKIIFEELSPLAEAIILFGSFAVGKEKPDSDVDLVIVGRSNKDKIKKILRRYPRKINVEFVSLMALQKAFQQKKALAVEIAKKHVLFGDVHAIVDVFVRFSVR